MVAPASRTTGAATAHDSDGDLTSVGGIGTFGWDTWCRLTTFTPSCAPTQPCYFTYDGFGHRVKQNGSGVNTTFYIFDGDLLLGELKPNTTFNRAYACGANDLVSQRNHRYGLPAR